MNKWVLSKVNGAFIVESIEVKAMYLISSFALSLKNHPRNYLNKILIDLALTAERQRSAHLSNDKRSKCN